MSSFVRFLLVGVFNTCFGYSLIFAFMYLAELSPELSNLLGYSIAIMVSFVLNKYFTFARKEPRNSLVTRADSRAELLRFLIVFACAYAANYVVLLLLIYKLQINAGVSQLVAGIVYVGISYFLNARFVFRYFSPRTISRHSGD